MMLVNIAVLALLMWYLDKVVPNEVSRARFLSIAFPSVTGVLACEPHGHRVSSDFVDVLEIWVSVLSNRLIGCFR